MCFLIVLLKTKIPVRGRKRAPLFERIRNIFYGLLKTKIPVRGRKPFLFYFIIKIDTAAVKNKNPRKGTETNPNQCLILLKEGYVKNKNPRKGTETSFSLASFSVTKH